ncbi:MAG TPA: hypothetical protein VGB87_02725 [Vicinamibacteria bacterium]
MTGRTAVVLGALVAAAAVAAAEPVFLSRQYTRCTSCHYSPTGGGLLTPYGRSLSREELSTFGRSSSAGPAGREHEFLFGATRDALRPVTAGIDLRPSHLDVRSPGYADKRDFLMNAELAVAMQRGGLTLYGSVGRQPRGDETRVASFEHWASYRTASGLGVRAGRFLPAYGVKLADHTAFTRSTLGLDNDRQVYGLELSFTGDRHLVQVSAGPGPADSVDDAEARAFTATGRWQFDLRPRVVLVASGLFRAASDLEAQSGATGLALGVVPVSRLTLWTQADARFREGTSGGPAYTFLADASFEAYRGVWVRLSPQLRTDFGDTSAGVLRLALGLNLLPRTHWNVLLSYYHDRDRVTDRTSKTLLVQLHLYL